MKRILVPCDFSTQSREAFKFALSIGEKTNAEVTVLHVIYVPVMFDPALAGVASSYDPLWSTAVEEDAKKRFEKMANDIPEKSVKISLQLYRGDIISGIKSAIDNSKIDLIIMGTTGASGFQEIFIGSTTEKVVRHSPVPVFAVRTAPSIDSIKKILLPTTLGLNQTEFMQKVKELLDFFDASLNILLINTPFHFKPDSEAKALLREFVTHYKLKNYRLHFKNHFTVEQGIIEFARDEKVDLIAMPTHAWKGLSHLFNGSVTEDVVNHIQSPVWTYRLIK